MVLLLRPDPPFVEFCKAEDGEFFVDRIISTPEEISKIVGKYEQIDGIGHLLCHGGEIFKDTLNTLDNSTLIKIERCIGFSPEKNDLTLKLARLFIEKFPKIPQILFCDTAYFADLPREVSTYAVSHILRDQGIRRYGGYGLIHRWAWKQIKAIRQNTRSVISIHLGDNPNIAAIQEGKPVETTIGFTPAEGLPSSGGCGDVDPTIVFLLYSKGMSVEEISGILSKNSGFRGLAGRECSYLDIVTDKKSVRISELKQILRYGIIRYIGAFMSKLESMDGIIFVTRYLTQSESFIKDICKGLDFLGLSEKNITCLKNDQDKVKEASKIFCLEQSQWSIMAQEIKDKITKEKQNE